MMIVAEGEESRTSTRETSSSNIPLRVEDVLVQGNLGRELE